MKSAWFLVFLLPTGASAAERWAVPDPLVTPGAVNPAVTIEALCNQTGLDRKKPNLPAWVTEFELSSYNIPSGESANYVLDYLIPPSLGGANTLSNVWPQPRTQADRKAALESEMQHRVCRTFKERPPEAPAILMNAQHDLAEDWTAAYAAYVDRGPRP